MHFSALPVEIILEVVANLNSYSVIALLNALPSLKQLAVILTRRSVDDTPAFFNISGVARRDLSIPADHYPHPPGQRLVLFDETRDRFPIKLIEDLAYSSNLDSYMQWPFGGRSAFRSPSLLDATTFIFFETAPNHWRHPSIGKTFVWFNVYQNKAPGTPWEYLDENTTCTWHIGHALYPSNRESDSLCLTEGRSPLNNLFTTLKYLRISGTFAVDHIHLPELEDFIVSFEGFNTARPILRDIKVESVKKFVIHYDSVLPVITDIHCGVNPGDRWLPDMLKKNFELSNLRSLQFNRESPLFRQSVTSMPKYSKDTLDLSFVGHGFKSVMIHGAPVYVTTLCQYTFVQCVNFVFSLDEDPSESVELPSLDMPDLLDLVITVIGSNVTLPTITKIPDRHWRAGFHLSLLNPVVNTDAFASEEKGFHGFFYARVYRSLSFLKDAATRDFHLTDSWKWILSFALTTYVCGFDMPFLQNPLDLVNEWEPFCLNGVGWFRRYGTTPHLHMTLRPTIPYSSLETGKFTVHIPQPHSAEYSTTYKLYPIPLKNIDVSKLILDIHIQGMAEMSKFELLPGFKEYRVNGVEVPVVPFLTWVRPPFVSYDGHCRELVDDSLKRGISSRVEIVWACLPRQRPQTRTRNRGALIRASELGSMLLGRTLIESELVYGEIIGEKASAMYPRRWVYYKVSDVAALEL